MVNFRHQERVKKISEVEMPRCHAAVKLTGPVRATSFIKPLIFSTPLPIRPTTGNARAGASHAPFGMASRVPLH